MTRRIVLDDPGVDRARAVLVNIENHVNVVGWKNIEAIELVIHGPALRTFIAKDIDPEVRGKLDTLLAGGLRSTPARTRWRARRSS